VSNDPTQFQNSLSQIAGFDPEAALQLQASHAQQQKAAQDLQWDQLSKAGQAYGAIADLPDDQILPAAQQALAIAKSHGADTSQIEPIVASGDPNKIRQFATLAAKVSMSRAQQLSQANADRTYQAGREDHADTVSYQNRSLGETSRHNRIQEQAAAQKAAQGELTPDALFMAAAQYNIDHKMPSLGRTAAARSQIINEAAKQLVAKGVAPEEAMARVAEYQGTLAGERTLGNRTATAGMAVNEFLPMVDQAKDAMSKVSRSGFLPLGKLQEAIQNNTNDPNLRTAAAAVNAVINTYARAINPTGTPTDSDKQHAREVLSTAYDQNSFNAVLDQLKMEANAALQSPGKTRGEFHEVITNGYQNPAPAQPSAQVGGSGWSIKVKGQ
jgi:hypothetical protein